MKYLAFGLIIQSEIELHTLIVDESGRKPDVEISRADLSGLVSEVKSEGNFFAELEDLVHWVFFSEVGDFLIKDGTHIFIDIMEQAIPGRIESILMGFCMGTIFYHRGDVSIHGGCVARKNETWIICGTSGAGKSTLVSELMKNRETSFLADDLVRISSDAIVSPSFPRQKLCVDLAERMSLELDRLELLNEERLKYGLDRRSVFCNEPKKIDAMFILKVGDSLNIRKITGLDKVQYFLSQFYPVYLYRLLDMQNIQITNSIKIVSKIDIYEITRPRGMDSALEQAALISQIRMNCQQEKHE